MVHASTKERLLKMFPRLKVKTFNAALETLIAKYGDKHGDLE